MMFEQILQKFLPIGSSVQKVLSHDCRIKEIEQEIGILSEVYTSKNDMLSKSHETDLGARIVSEHETFLKEYLQRVGDLRKELRKIQEHKDILLKSTDVKDGYHLAKSKVAIRKLVEQKKSGEITKGYFDTLYKAISGKDKVLYSDMIATNREGKILLLKRGVNDTSNAGKWGIPGGHVDPGEDHKTAAVRELFEESGIKVKPEDVNLTAVYDNDDVHIEYFSVYCDQEVITILLDSEEGQDYAWVAAKELANYEMVFNMQENLTFILRLTGSIFEENVVDVPKDLEVKTEEKEPIEKARKDIGKLRKVRKLVTRGGKTFITTVYVSDEDEIKDEEAPVEGRVSEAFTPDLDFEVGESVSIRTKSKKDLVGVVAGFFKDKKDDLYMRLRKSDGVCDYVMLRGVKGIVKTTGVETTPVEKPSLKMKLEDFTQVKRLGGSSEVGLYEFEGLKYAIKKPNAKGGIKQIEEENLADNIYRALGIDVPDSIIIDGAKVSTYINGKELGASVVTDSVKEELQKGFVADCLLANWDVLGGSKDNIIVDDERKRVFRIDNGGSLRFRARGGDKSSSFGTSVTEIDSMRADPQNKGIFDDITDAQIREQVKAISDKKDAILSLIDDPTLKNKMHLRISDLEDRYPTISESTPEEPREVPRADMPSLTTQEYFDNGWDELELEGNEGIKDKIKQNILNIERRNEKQYRELADGKGVSVEEIKRELQDLVERAVRKADCYIAVHTSGDNSVLDMILEDGRFKSQFETGSSEGSLDKGFRSSTENAYFGFQNEDLKLLKDQRPIYGYFSQNSNGVINESGSIPPPNETNQYGDISFKVKKDIAKKKATITFQDSLGYENGCVATPFTKPHFTSLKNMSSWKLERLRSMADGDGTMLSSYVEAQYHNQLKIGDLESIHLSPNNFVRDEIGSDLDSRYQRLSKIVTSISTKIHKSGNPDLKIEIFDHK